LHRASETPAHALADLRPLGPPYQDLYYSRFDTVVGEESTQLEVYNEGVKGLVDDVLNGFNTGMFAYGQSGGGKSFSLLGKEGCLLDPVMMGIIPRVIFDLFKACPQDDTGELGFGEAREETTITVQFFELYLNDIFDLLLPEENYIPNPSGSGLQGLVKLPGREDRHMNKLTNQKVTSAEEAIKMVELGTARRRYAAMPLNPVSSRSHGILKINLNRRFKDRTQVSSSLAFADLMGSEALVEGWDTNISETASINNDLLVLGRIITALGSKGGGATSYRDSTLTWVMREVLGGNTKATVLITCSPHKMQYQATQNTLKFGDKCKGINRKVQSSRKRLTAAELEVIVQRMQRELDKRQARIDELESQLMVAAAGGAIDLASGTRGSMGAAAAAGLPRAGGGGGGGGPSGGGGGGGGGELSKEQEEKLQQELKEAEEKMEGEREMFKKQIVELEDRMVQDRQKAAFKIAKATERESQMMKQITEVEEGTKKFEAEIEELEKKIIEEQQKAFESASKVEEGADKTEELHAAVKQLEEAGAAADAEIQKQYNEVAEVSKELAEARTAFGMKEKEIERLEESLHKAEELQSILSAGGQAKHLDLQMKLANSTDAGEKAAFQAQLDSAVAATQASEDAVTNRLKSAEGALRTKEAELDKAAHGMMEASESAKKLGEELEKVNKEHEKELKKVI